MIIEPSHVIFSHFSDFILGDMNTSLPGYENIGTVLLLTVISLLSCCL